MSEPVADRTPGSVDVAGPEDGPPIVLVHGTVFNRTMWAPQREALSDEFRVIVPDLPGHGDRRDEPFRLEEGIETVASLVDGLDEDSVHLVGLSLGGYVATAFAGRNPEQVEGLVVADSSANPVGLLGTASKLVGKATLLAARSELVERAVDELTARWVESRDLSPEVESEIVRAGFDLKPFGQGGVEIAGRDFRRMFAGFDGPALVVNGEWDFLMRRGEDAHAEAAQDASVTVVDGAGHTSSLDEPEAFESIVREFVATAEYGRTPPP